MSVLLIAEAGVNHNGDLELAKRLIHAAAEAGADYVKFQTFVAERLVTLDAAKAPYQKETTGSDETQYNMLKKLELSEEMHVALMAECESQGIRFLSTGFDIQSVEYLHRLDLGLFKIPSGEITNVPYLRRIASFGTPVILSTGMATMMEVESAIECLLQGGAERSDITVLHCTTDYPADFRDVNLKAMQTIRDAFGVSVGYSDHTPGIEVSLAAVALGATVIEKHFTVDRTLPGPDQKASLEPDELRNLVAGVRNIEQALGDGVKAPRESELMNREVARKSIVAACDIAEGETFTEENLTTRRPETGVGAGKWDSVIGRSAGRAYRAGELIQSD
ncbi:MAG: N-acetylneuraminate synthase [bacterium]|nr:N-acetylneuraminate synthase [bacterium]